LRLPHISTSQPGVAVEAAFDRKGEAMHFGIESSG